MKKLGAIEIDEKNCRFRTQYKEFSFLRAVCTFLLIRYKTIRSPWIPYSKMVSFDTRFGSERQRSGIGIGTSIGSLGIGTGSSVSKNVTTSAEVIITIDDLKNPSITIPIMKKPLRGGKLDKAQRMLDDTVSALNYIMRHK